MTFKINDAFRVAEHYQTIIGKDFNNKENAEYPINYVVVAPNYGERFQKFISYFLQSEDNKASLAMSGFDESEVLVVAICYNEFRNVTLYEDIDSFLGNNNLEKVYTNGNFLLNNSD